MAPLNPIQQQQADEVGRCMRTHVASIQAKLIQSMDQDADGRVVARRSLALTSEEMLAVQGLLTMFNAADSLFGGR